MHMEDEGVELDIWESVTRNLWQNDVAAQGRFEREVDTRQMLNSAAYGQQAKTCDGAISLIISSCTRKAPRAQDFAYRRCP